MLKMPTLLPKELRHFESVESEDELYQRLIKRPDILTYFLETSLEDETWSEHNAVFTQKILEWISDQYLVGNFPQAFAERLTKVIQPHFGVLQRFLPNSIVVHLHDKSIDINPLLFGTASPHFLDLLVHECRERESHDLSLPIKAVPFQPLGEFLQTGTVRDIWKKPQPELMAILADATRWRAAGLSELCQQTLKRYIDRASVIELLLQSHLERWALLRSDCYDYANQLPFDVKFHESAIDELAFEFLQFSESALKVFKKLKERITILTVSKLLVENPLFSQVVRDCPLLNILDVTGSENFSDEFLTLPASLRGFKLAQCPWLSNALFKKIVGITPHLIELSLASNPQLTAEGWGAISRLKSLKRLDLSHCSQISDEDLKLILRGFPYGTDLVLNECKKISDRGFYEMARTNPRYVTLDLSRCHIGDMGLIEMSTRCQQLVRLKLVRCENITELGLLESAKHAASLKEIDITRCEISPDAIRELKDLKPFLEVIV